MKGGPPYVIFVGWGWQLTRKLVKSGCPIFPAFARSWGFEFLGQVPHRHTLVAFCATGSALSEVEGVGT